MARTKESTAGSSKPKSGNGALVKYYLVAYNILSAVGWGYILVSLVTHLVSPSGLAPSPSSTAKASATLARLLSSIPFLKSTFGPSSVLSHVHPALLPYFERASSAYAAVGEQTAWVQTVAVLEIVHAVLGFVRSPIATTVMQVFSRLALVWGIAEQYDVARTNPLYASMVLAWSLTEVVRYAYYAFSLVSTPPHFLLWLRYTTFYILYPVGAGSEAFIVFSTLPSVASLGAWTASEYVRGVMFVIWWPALYVLYTHMLKQRRKFLGTGAGRTLGGSKKTQ